MAHPACGGRARCRRCPRIRRLDRLWPRADRFRRPGPGCAQRLQAGRSDRRSREPQGCEPHRPGALSHPRRRLRGLPYGHRGTIFRRGPGVRPALWHDLFDQHHARQGHGHRPVHRRGFSRGGPSRRPARRRAALPRNALRQLHLPDGRRHARHQSLSLQPEADQRARDSEYLRLSVRSALGDGNMGDDVQREPAFRAARQSERRVEPRRLSGRGACPLRRMPYAPQSVPGAGQPPQIRRRRHRRLARLQHHQRSDERRRRLDRSRRSRITSPRDMPRGAARRQGRWAKRSTSASCI